MIVALICTLHYYSTVTVNFRTEYDYLKLKSEDEKEYLEVHVTKDWTDSTKNWYTRTSKENPKHKLTGWVTCQEKN